MRVINGIVYRNADFNDIDALCLLDADKWNEKLAAGRDKWVSRIEIFPEGIYVAVKDSRLIGVAASVIIKYPDDYFLTWAEATADGYITNHDPVNGDTVYGVDFSVDSQYPRVAANLLTCIIEDLMRGRNLGGMLGCPAPFVSEHKNKTGQTELNEEQVMELADKDPLIEHLFKALGIKIVGVRKDYLPEDTDSDGWGIILELE